MTYTIKQYEDKYYEKWNKFVEDSTNGTLFHRLDFLDYHQDRFTQNTHHILFFKGEAIVAVMPMAIFSYGDLKVAKSPYGGSFGGLVLRANVSLSESQALIAALIDYCIGESIASLEMVTAPNLYTDGNFENIEYSLLAGGFELSAADLFSIVRLPETLETLWNRFQGRARSTIRKYENTFKIIENVTVDQFYPILMQDKARHNSNPTHSLEELTFLKEKFPDQIIIDIAEHETGALAGVCYFRNRKTIDSTFYMAQEDKAVGLNGTNILVYIGMQRAIKNNCSWFDFGSSTFGYNVDNYGVSKFKESFGAQGFLRKKYVLKIS